MTMKVCDPVCGKEIDLADAVASEDHGGWAHFFCSKACRDAFNSSPERFSQAPGATPAHPATTGNTQSRNFECHDD